MENKKKKIIFDCDNTFGVTDCDVDDGLALLYLLDVRMRKSVELQELMEIIILM